MLKTPSLLRYNVFSYLGSDGPDVVDSGRPKDNIFQDNTFKGGLESIKIKEADGTQFIDNKFEDAEVLRFDDATDTLMEGNSGLSDMELKVRNSACFDEDSDNDFEPIC